MGDLLGKVNSWWNGVRSAPVERQIADMIASGGVREDKFSARVAGDAFVSGTTYFGIRLSGLHIVDARKFATERLPLCVCLAEFETGGERRTLPFSIGPDVLRNKLRDAGVTENTVGTAWIELHDLTIVRPTPVNNSNLSLYTGLFSVPGDDLVKTLLNVVGSIGTALGQPTVSPGLKIAETVYDSFGALLGFNQVQQVAAALIGNALTEQGSGYLLVANVIPEHFDVKRAQVVGGRLCWPTDQNGGKAVVEFDHALLALECFSSVAEKGTGLAEALFGKSWEGVRKAANRATANEALDKLRDAISASSDLTEDDRLRLLVAYGAIAEKLISARWPTNSDAAERSGGTRGSAGENLQTRLDKVVSRLDRDGGTENSEVAGRLRDISVALDRLPELPDPQSYSVENTRLGDESAILTMAKTIGVEWPKDGQHDRARHASTIVGSAISRAGL